MTFHHQVSAVVGLICLVAAGLIWFFGNRHTPRLVVGFIVTGVSGLLDTGIGSRYRDAVEWADDASSSMIGTATGVTLSGLLGCVIAYLLFIDLKNKKVGEKTLAAAALAPVAVNSIPGVAGDILSSCLNGIGWLVSGPISLLFFGHW